jgi:hypothetical protein
LPALRWTIVFCISAIALVATTATPAAPTERRCLGDYSYAGVVGTKGVNGASARIAPLRSPQVAGGHVAAWVGVGGEGLGPGGTTEWIQAGLGAFADGRVELYYEVTLPGSDPRYVALGDGRTPHTVAVVEVQRQPNWWRVWVDGRPASAAFHLPGSHGKFVPTVTAESWDGGDGACNGFAYRFTRLRVRTTVAATWHPLQRPRLLEDPGLVLLRRQDGFEARALG